VERSLKLIANLSAQNLVAVLVFKLIDFEQDECNGIWTAEKLRSC